MNNHDIRQELQYRLEQGVKSNYLSSYVNKIYFDFDSDIMIIELKPGENKGDFYEKLVDNRILQKNDQISIVNSKV
jgi:hypothetical protein